MLVLAVKKKRSEWLAVQYTALRQRNQGFHGHYQLVAIVLDLGKSLSWISGLICYVDTGSALHYTVTSKRPRAHFPGPLWEGGRPIESQLPGSAPDCLHAGIHPSTNPAQEYPLTRVRSCPISLDERLRYRFHFLGRMSGPIGTRFHNFGQLCNFNYWL